MHSDWGGLPGFGVSFFPDPGSPPPKHVNCVFGGGGGRRRGGLFLEQSKWPGISLSHLYDQRSAVKKTPECAHSGRDFPFSPLFVAVLMWWHVAGTQQILVE